MEAREVAWEVWEVAWGELVDMEVENKHNTVSNHHSLQRLSVMLSLTWEDMVPVMDNLAASVVQEVDQDQEVDLVQEVDLDLEVDLDQEVDPDQEVDLDQEVDPALD